jgi:hypothetical protein
VNAGTIYANFANTGLRPRVNGERRSLDRVIYIAGAGYSGSTLLSFLLNSSPEIASVGEATGPHLAEKNQPTFPCSCGAVLKDCEFWREIGDQMRSRGFDFGPGNWNTRFFLSDRRIVNLVLTRSSFHEGVDAIRDAVVQRTPALGRRLRELGARNEAVVAAILATTGKSVFADASKDPVRVGFLERLTNFDLRVVHLVRDSLGFVSSHVKNNQSSVEVGIRHWNRTAGQMQRLFERLPPGRRLRVRYEDLCANPEAELGRIHEMARLASTPGPVDFRAAEHHIIGNRMRLGSSSEIVLDESWRERLTSLEIEEIRSRTEVYRERFGYE